MQRNMDRVNALLKGLGFVLMLLQFPCQIFSYSDYRLFPLLIDGRGRPTASVVAVLFEQWYGLSLQGNRLRDGVI